MMPEDYLPDAVTLLSLWHADLRPDERNDARLVALELIAHRIADQGCVNRDDLLAALGRAELEIHAHRMHAHPSGTTGDQN